MAQIELVLKMEEEVWGDVDMEEKSVLKYALLAFVAPCVDAVYEFLLVAVGVTHVVTQFLWVCSFKDEETHKVEFVANSEVTVVGVLELVAYGTACAEVVAPHGVVVGGTTSDGDCGKHEIVREGVGGTLTLGIESCSETGCL